MKRKKGLQNLWIAKQLNYDNIAYSYIKEQTSYMEDVAHDNREMLSEDDHSIDYHYWAAFHEILQEFNSRAISGYVVTKEIENAHIRGMLDAMNVICSGVKLGEFDIENERRK